MLGARNLLIKRDKRAYLSKLSEKLEKGTLCSSRLLPTSGCNAPFMIISPADIGNKELWQNTVRLTTGTTRPMLTNMRMFHNASFEIEVSIDPITILVAQ